MSKARILSEIQEDIQNCISKLESDDILESINFILDTHTVNLITIYSEPLDVLNISYLNSLQKDMIKIKQLLKECYIVWIE